MPTTNTLVRTMHDTGLAAWFGGSLMGAIGLNGGAATAQVPEERTRIASRGWAKWAPVNAAAIAVHGIGGLGLITSNRRRIGHQNGVLKYTILKTIPTLGAAAATAYAGKLGRDIAKRPNSPTSGSTTPGAITDSDLATAQQREKAMQWVVPGLLGIVLALHAAMGEQQRAASVLTGVAQKLSPR